MEHVYKGRTFTEVRREPYTRKDGTTTELIVWRSECVECGAPFEIKTPAASALENTQAFGRARCDTHKKTWSEIRKGWNAQQKANKQINGGSECADLC